MYIRINYQMQEKEIFCVNKNLFKNKLIKGKVK